MGWFDQLEAAKQQSTSSGGTSSPAVPTNTVVDPNTLKFGPGGSSTGTYSTDPNSLLGSFTGASSGGPEAYLKQLLTSGLRGQQAADMVNQKFPNAVNWRQDRNFFDFPGSNSYVHQTDQGGWAGPWDLVQRGAEGGGGAANPGALNSLSSIGPFNYSSSFKPETFTPNGPAPKATEFKPGEAPFKPETFVAPEKKAQPADFKAPTLDDTNDPGYQFRLDQTRAAVERSAAAKGTLLTGGTQKDIVNYIGDAASAEYANVYARAFGEQQNAYNQWLTSDQNTFGQAFNTNQLNNAQNLAANQNTFNQNFSTNQLNNANTLAFNQNDFNQKFQTTQLNNSTNLAADQNAFNQQLQTHSTNYNDLFNIANLGFNATNASFQ